MEKWRNERNKKVVFIILNFNTYKDTIRQVEEILEWKREQFQIVVVDNNSPNSSFDILFGLFSDNDFIDVIKTSKNEGFAKGNNFGLRYAEKYYPEFVCVINNDVHFTEETIETLCNLYDQLESPAIIAPIQMLPGGKRAKFKELRIPTFWSYIRDYTLFISQAQHNYYSNTRFQNAQRVEWIPGAFMFAKYVVFKQLGFFDEDTFLYGEESLLARKIKNLGLSNYIVLNKEYVHEHSKTISTVVSLKRQRKLQYEGRVIFVKKNEHHFLNTKIAILWMAYRYNTICIMVYYGFINLFKLFKRRKFN